MGPRRCAAAMMPEALPARPVSTSVRPSSSWTRKELIMPKRVRRISRLVSCTCLTMRAEEESHKKVQGSAAHAWRFRPGLLVCVRCLRRDRLGFFNQDDFFKVANALEDNKFSRDLITRAESLGLLSVRNHIAHSHGRHKSGNFPMLDDDCLCGRSTLMTSACEMKKRLSVS